MIQAYMYVCMCVCVCVCVCSWYWHNDDDDDDDDDDEKREEEDMITVKRQIKISSFENMNYFSVKLYSSYRTEITEKYFLCTNY